MAGSSTPLQIDYWHLDGNLARLRAPALTGQIESPRPEQGLQQITWHGHEIQGHLLGVSAGEHSVTRETFTRSSDLVALFESELPRRFQWQVYWRTVATKGGHGQVDLIVSLQTPLLQSFPSFTTTSSLPAEEICFAFQANREYEPLDMGRSANDPRMDLTSVLFRASDSPWSYLEMVHPEDQALTTLDRDSKGFVTMQRSIGGAFLEKGVIRRMRIRGVLLPSESDLQQAASLFRAFCNEEPPLTT